MTREKILLIGGGGHCSSVIDIIESEGKFEIAGIIDLPSKKGETIAGYKIIATDDDLEKLAADYQYFFVTIGQIKNNEQRKKIFAQIKSLNITPPILVSPRAYVSKHSTIAEGTIVMHNSFINIHSNIGKNCIINTSSIIEHNVSIGNHCHISTGSIINGDCIIEDDCFIGSNAVIANNIKIAAGSIVGAGAVVINDVKPGSVIIGNPGKLKNSK